MAPIQMEKAYEMRDSSSSGVMCSRCRKSSESSWDEVLPITRRGRFFQDSFFSDIHKDFDSSIRKVLDRWSGNDFKFRDTWDRSDVMGRYRELRSRNLKEENQAVTVTSDNTSHKIVLDVHDFMGGDVKVKVLDEEELLVEGRMEKGGEGSTSLSSHSFRRYFSLPQDTDKDSIMSAISLDGILTITAPRKKRDTKVETSSNQSHETQSQTRAEASESTQSRLYADAGYDNLASRKERHCNTKSNFDHSGASRFRQDSWDDFLPITRRGRFFQDSCFSSIHRDFGDSLRKVLDGWDESERLFSDFWESDDDFRRSDVLGRYRHLRSRREAREDHHVVTVTSDNTSHKIVLDMHEYMEGDIKVKVSGEVELIVEGNTMKNSQTFRRRFSLPQNTDMKAITSVMSSDGILTITAPQNSEAQQRSTNIPITVDETSVSSTTSEDATHCTESASKATSVDATHCTETASKTTSADATHCTESASKTSSTEVHGQSENVFCDTETSHRTNTNNETDSMKTTDHSRCLSPETSSDTVVEVQGQMKVKITAGSKPEQVTIQEIEESVSNSATSAEKSLLQEIGSVAENFVNLNEHQTSKISCEDKKIEMQGIESSFDIEEIVESENSDICLSTSQIGLVVNSESNENFEGVTSVVSRDEGLESNNIISEDEGIEIERKGSFFQDSFFSDIWCDFDVAVRKALKKLDGSKVYDDLNQSEILKQYRKLRSQDSREENQVSIVTSNNTCFKIVLDVHDFMRGDVKVNVINELEIVVEGRMEKNYDAYSFRRSFHIPERIEMSAVATAMSSDGILIIIAPRMENDTQTIFTITEVEDNEDSECLNDSKQVVNQVESKVEIETDATSESYIVEETNDDDDDDDGVDDEEAYQESFMKRNMTRRGSCALEGKYEHSFATTEIKTEESILDDISEEVTGEREDVLEIDFNKDKLSKDECLTWSSSQKEVETSDHLSQDMESRTSQKSRLSDDVAVSAASHTEAQEEIVESRVASESYTQEKVKPNDSAIRNELETRNEMSADDSSLNTMGKDTHSKNLQSIFKEQSWAGRVIERTKASESLAAPARIRHDSLDESLLITRRGNFFEDSFFSAVRTDFDAAIREVLNKCNEASSSNEKEDSSKDLLESYRHLRSHNLREDNQAFIVTSDNTCQKIVLDVHDFMSGSIKVKVVDENLVVEGKVKWLDEDASHSFRRLFSLSKQTDVTAITSVLSLDGILTITAPVKIDDIFSKSLETEVLYQDSNTSEYDRKGKYIGHESEELVFDDNASKTAEDVNSQERFSTSERTSCASTSEGGERQTYYKHESRERSQGRAEPLEKDMCSSITRSAYTGLSSATRTLPVTKKGLFFYDSFFHDTRKAFQNAVRKVLTEWGQESAYGDEITSYRKLRTRDLREDNQAVTSTEDEHYYKFIIDVRDFMTEGEITVKAIDERELVVEGHLKRTENGLASTKRFLRHFVVPIDINIDAVTSVMSSDGVLIITAPKMIPRKARSKLSELVDAMESEVQTQKQFSDSYLRSGNDLENASISRSGDRAACDIINSREASVNSKFTSLSQDESQRRKLALDSIEDLDDLLLKKSDLTSSRRFSDEYRCGENSLMNKESSSEEEDFDFGRRRGSRCRFSFDDEEADGSFAMNKETDMSSAYKDYRYKAPSFSTETRTLHIERKGLFADEYFFVNVRSNYSQAVKEVLEKANEWTCRSDAAKNYRNLRLRNLKLENQAVNVSEDHSSHLIVMDVFDFLGGDVTVQLVKGKEVVVEGRAERQDGGRVSRLSFSRRFELPLLVDRDAITCAVSSDGILAIVSKKIRNAFSSLQGSSTEEKSHFGRSREDINARDLSDFKTSSSRRLGSGSRYQHSYANRY